MLGGAETGSENDCNHPDIELVWIKMFIYTDVCKNTCY